MAPTTTPTNRQVRAAERDALLNQEKARIAAINRLCAEHDIPAHLAGEFIEAGWSLEAVRDEILESKIAGPMRATILRVVSRSFADPSITRMQHLLSQGGHLTSGPKDLLLGGNVVARNLDVDFANAIVALSKLRQIRLEPRGIETLIRRGPKFPR